MGRLPSTEPCVAFQVPNLRWLTKQLAITTIANFPDAAAMVNKGMALPL